MRAPPGGGERTLRDVSRRVHAGVNEQPCVRLLYEQGLQTELRSGPVRASAGGTEGAFSTCYQHGEVREQHAALLF